MSSPLINGDRDGDRSHDRITALQVNNRDNTREWVTIELDPEPTYRVPNAAASKVWEQLAKLAFHPVLTPNTRTSDLYHDAAWLAKHLPTNPYDPRHPNHPNQWPPSGTFIFYWGCDESGTFIGTDGYLAATRYPDDLWVVEVTPSKWGRYDVRVTPVTNVTRN